MKPVSFLLKVAILASVAFFSLAAPFYADENLSVTNVKASLATFSPDKDGKNDSTALLFTLNKSAKVTVTVRTKTTIIKKIVTDMELGSGKRHVWWNGENSSGNVVKNGDYRYIITAVNGKETVKSSGYIRVECEKPEISEFSIKPATFSPDNNGFRDTSAIVFKQNTYTRLTVKIISHKGVVRTLFDGYKIHGSKQFKWNGRDSWGRLLANGSYRLDIKAEGSGGIAQKSALITIKNPKPKITDVRPTVQPFSPNGDRVKDITGFTYLLQSDAYIQVRILNYKGEIRKVFAGLRKPGRYYDLWDGINNLGWLISNGHYKYEITATNSVGSTVKTGVISVEGVVFSGPYAITVSVSARKLYLYRGRLLMKTYPIAVGMRSYPTPIGTYKITRKDINPTWYPPKWADVRNPVPYPKSPLGPRRLLLSDPSYGIHGTLDRNAIGKAVTHGCIRLYNEQIIELFNIVPVGTVVRIVR